MKICSCCKEELPLSSFYKQKGHSGGVMSLCKKCFNNYCTERWRLRKIHYITLMGGKCEACGIELTQNNYAIFDFHHKDPSEKEMEWTKIRLLSDNKIRQEIQKCKLLCANCHRLIHQNEH